MHKGSQPNNDLVIDWKLGIKLAGNKHDLAKDMLDWLVTSLPNEINAIRQANKNKNFPELLKHVHKLHGAVCYCGVPRLKATVSSFETALKNNETNEIDFFLLALEFEIAQVLEKAAQMESDS